MDPAQLKAAYDQTQYISDAIKNVDFDVFKTTAAQTTQLLDSQDKSQYANENRQNRNFNLLNDSIKGEGASTKDAIYRTSAVINDNIGKGAADNLLATERTSSHLDDNIYIIDNFLTEEEHIKLFTFCQDPNNWITMDIKSEYRNKTWDNNIKFLDNVTK